MTELIFAYGSNMFAARLRGRAASARAVTTGCLPGHALVFHKRGLDGSAKADAHRTGRHQDQVWGVVYRIRADERRHLDRAEQLGTGYDLRQVEIAAEGCTLPAWAYHARSEVVVGDLLPFTWYKHFVVEGARQHGLPAAYVRMLERHPAGRDPDVDRHLANLRLLVQLAGGESASHRLSA